MSLILSHLKPPQVCTTQPIAKTPNAVRWNLLRVTVTIPLRSLQDLAGLDRVDHILGGKLSELLVAGVTRLGVDELEILRLELVQRHRDELGEVLGVLRLLRDDLGDARGLDGFGIRESLLHS